MRVALRKVGNRPRSGDRILRCKCVLILTVCWICSCTGPKAPPLPSVDLSAFQPGVREVIEDALSKAQAHPDDADAVGRLGMVLHAHDQFAAAVKSYQRACSLDPKRP